MELPQKPQTGRDSKSRRDAEKQTRLKSFRYEAFSTRQVGAEVCRRAGAAEQSWTQLVTPPSRAGATWLPCVYDVEFRGVRESRGRLGMLGREAGASASASKVLRRREEIGGTR